MWAPLRSTSCWFLLGLALWSGAGAAMADAAPDPLLGYRTTPQIHGLYEIREEAIHYLDRDAVRKKAGWRALDPDIRIQVDKCAVPLKSRWLDKSAEFPYPTIEVVCDKTVDRRNPHWSVAVPVHKR